MRSVICLNSINNILLFKKGSYLINTSRGGLVDTQALVLGLQRGIIEGVGLDVLEEEKPLSEEVAILTSKYKSEANIEGLVYDFILINNPKVLITPHNAFNSKEALDRILETTIENVKGYLNSKPIKKNVGRSLKIFQHAAMT